LEETSVKEMERKGLMNKANNFRKRAIIGLLALITLTLLLISSVRMDVSDYFRYPAGNSPLEENEEGFKQLKHN
jgi:hypothetical protein